MTVLLPFHGASDSDDIYGSLRDDATAPVQAAAVSGCATV
jgi:hypothetical protein